MHPVIALSALALAPSAASQPSVQDGSTAPPPGTVLVEGERTEVGLELDDAEELILEEEGLRGAIIGETPQHEVKVEDFYLMATEVTNEQYARFVRAAGAKPPLAWGKEAIDEGRRAFLEAEGKARQAAKEAGQPIPERQIFDAQTWWSQHWRDAEWEVPQKLANHPVTHVDYQGATAYARWAGMRLPTEFEYQCAVRGRTTDIYPWGDDWDDRKYAHSGHYGLDDTMPVGSFPAGATKAGVYDLAGSVWEWTSSPYTAYPGYEPIKNMMVGNGRNERRIEAYADFDANKRVVVGGSYKTGRLTLRVTTRLGAERFQSTDALGFRCAASLAPGKDMADTILLEDMRPSRRPVGVDYTTDPAFVVALDHWDTSEGTSKVEGYSVIESYSNILFIPVAEMNANDESKVRDLSESYGIVHLGILSTTVPLIQPEVQPGTYMFGYRGRGETRPSDDEDGPDPIVLDEKLDIEKDHFVLLDTDGSFVATLPVERFEKGKLKKKPGAVTVREIRRNPKDKPEVQAKVLERDELVFSVFVEGRSKRSGFFADFPLGVAPGTVDEGWRKP